MWRCTGSADTCMFAISGVNAVYLAAPNSGTTAAAPFTMACGISCAGCQRASCVEFCGTGPVCAAPSAAICRCGMVQIPHALTIMAMATDRQTQMRTMCTCATVFLLLSIFWCSMPQRALNCSFIVGGITTPVLMSSGAHTHHPPTVDRFCKCAFVCNRGSSNCWHDMQRVANTAERSFAVLATVHILAGLLQQPHMGGVTCDKDAGWQTMNKEQCARVKLAAKPGLSSWVDASRVVYCALTMILTACAGGTLMQGAGFSRPTKVAAVATWYTMMVSAHEQAASTQLHSGDAVITAASMCVQGHGCGNSFVSAAVSMVQPWRWLVHFASGMRPLYSLVDWKIACYAPSNEALEINFCNWRDVKRVGREWWRDSAVPGKAAAWESSAKTHNKGVCSYEPHKQKVSASSQSMWYDALKNTPTCTHMCAHHQMGLAWAWCVAGRAANSVSNEFYSNSALVEYFESWWTSVYTKPRPVELVFDVFALWKLRVFPPVRVAIALVWFLAMTLSRAAMVPLAIWDPTMLASISARLVMGVTSLSHEIFVATGDTMAVLRGPDEGGSVSFVGAALLYYYVFRRRSVMCEMSAFALRLLSGVSSPISYDHSELLVAAAPIEVLGANGEAEQLMIDMSSSSVAIADVDMISDSNTPYVLADVNRKFVESMQEPLPSTAKNESKTHRSIVDVIYDAAAAAAALYMRLTNNRQGYTYQCETALQLANASLNTNIEKQKLLSLYMRNSVIAVRDTLHEHSICRAVPGGHDIGAVSHIGLLYTAAISAASTLMTSVRAAISAVSALAGPVSLFSMFTAASDFFKNLRNLTDFIQSMMHAVTTTTGVVNNETCNQFTNSQTNMLAVYAAAPVPPERATLCAKNNQKLQAAREKDILELYAYIAKLQGPGQLDVGWYNSMRDNPRVQLLLNNVNKSTRAYTKHMAQRTFECANDDEGARHEYRKSPLCFRLDESYAASCQVSTSSHKGSVDEFRFKACLLHESGLDIASAAPCDMLDVYGPYHGGYNVEASKATAIKLENWTHRVDQMVAEAANGGMPEHICKPRFNCQMNTSAAQCSATDFRLGETEKLQCYCDKNAEHEASGTNCSVCHNDRSKVQPALNGEISQCSYTYDRSSSVLNSCQKHAGIAHNSTVVTPLQMCDVHSCTFGTSPDQRNHLREATVRDFENGTAVQGTWSHTSFIRNCTTTTKTTMNPDVNSLHNLLSADRPWGGIGLPHHDQFGVYGTPEATKHALRYPYVVDMSKGHDCQMVSAEQLRLDVVALVALDDSSSEDVLRGVLTNEVAGCYPHGCNPPKCSTHNEIQRCDKLCSNITGTVASTPTYCHENLSNFKCNTYLGCRMRQGYLTVQGGTQREIGDKCSYKSATGPHATHLIFDKAKGQSADAQFAKKWETITDWAGEEPSAAASDVNTLKSDLITIMAWSAFCVQHGRYLKPHTDGSLHALVCKGGHHNTAANKCSGVEGSLQSPFSFGHSKENLMTFKENMGSLLRSYWASEAGYSSKDFAKAVSAVNDDHMRYADAFERGSCDFMKHEGFFTRRVFKRKTHTDDCHVYLLDVQAARALPVRRATPFANNNENNTTPSGWNRPWLPEEQWT